MDADTEAYNYVQEHALNDAQKGVSVNDQIVAAFAAGWNRALEIASAAADEAKG